MSREPRAAMPPRSSSTAQLAVEFVGDAKASRLLLTAGGARVEDASGAEGGGGGTAASVGPALRAAFRHAFLPDGYPASVSSDYLSAWVSGGSCCSAISGRSLSVSLAPKQLHFPKGTFHHAISCLHPTRLPRLPAVGLDPGPEQLRTRHAVLPSHAGRGGGRLCRRHAAGCRLPGGC